MPPKKLGTSFKTIEIKCINNHKVALYRKPKAEWGERTHKLWLIQERLKQLNVTPSIFEDNTLNIPPIGTEIICKHQGCGLPIGKIEMIKGHVAIELIKKNIQRTKG